MLPESRLRGLLRPEYLALSVILLAAAWLRLRGLDFGLPAIYDADEPIFVLTALKLLRQGTLNPEWFGHPGTTTIYTLALVYAGVLGGGLLTGRFASVSAMGEAIYRDPGIVFLPGRWFILCCALVTILLTFVLARRLFGARAGLIAAAVLCVSPVHIKYAQIIRTDMHQTVFLLLCALAATSIVQQGRTRDYVWAAIWLGLACATKWPAGIMASAVIGAAGWRMVHGPEGWRTVLSRLVLAGALTPVALIAASPYLVLDFPTVLLHLSAEARTHHPGATGQGFWANIGWYLTQPLRHALGLAGLLLSGAGLILGARRSAAFAVTAVPFVSLSLLSISAQALIWERWVVPLLPFLAIAVAVSVEALSKLVATRSRAWRIAGGGAIAAMLLAPLLIAGHADATERAHDTRARASAWARAHIPPRSTVLVEHLAFDLLGTGWRYLYPVGAAGCIDVAASLRAKIPYTTVERWRAGRSVIDLGTIDPQRFDTCRADYAIIVNYDRYLLEPQTYSAEWSIYRALIAHGQIVATFRPEPGRVGGPVMRIVHLNARPSEWAASTPTARADRR